MNRDALLGLASREGFKRENNWLFTATDLERFADILMAVQKENDAKMCEFYAEKIGTENITGKALIATAFEIRNRK